MARKPKTVHTPEGKSLSVNFGGAKISEIRRVDPASAVVKFHCAMTAYTGFFTKMGWSEPGAKTTKESLEGKLVGGNFIFTSRDKLVSRELDIEYSHIAGFECHRLELEGRKGKGFRRELRFTITLKGEDCMAQLESYMMTNDNARGSLKIVYFPEAVQTKMNMGDDDQLKLTDEQREAVGEEAD